MSSKANARKFFEQSLGEAAFSTWLKKRRGRRIDIRYQGEFWMLCAWEPLYQNEVAATAIGMTLMQAQNELALLLRENP